MKMAEEIDVLNKRVFDLEKNNNNKPVASNFVIPSNLDSGINQKAEYKKGEKQANFDIKFIGAESLTFSERMQKTENFLKELVTLLGAYNVYKLSGEYVWDIQKK